MGGSPFSRLLQQSNKAACFSRRRPHLVTIMTADAPTTKASASADEMEFIAADLTLYSNPLNTALTSTAPPPPKKEDPKDKKDGEKEEKEEDVVAADLTKYDSPMTQLDRKHKENKK